MSVCAVIGGISLLVANGNFTLAWTHSVQHVRWEEDWRMEADGLHLAEARVKGPGAGMEAPPDAIWRDGWWHYTPPLAALDRLELANSPHGGAYEICIEDGCRPLPRPLGDAAGPTFLQDCARAAGS